jgi:hypothetical protein
LVREKVSVSLTSTTVIVNSFANPDSLLVLGSSFNFEKIFRMDTASINTVVGSLAASNMNHSINNNRRTIGCSVTRGSREINISYFPPFFKFFFLFLFFCFSITKNDVFSE